MGQEQSGVIHLVAPQAPTVPVWAAAGKVWIEVDDHEGAAIPEDAIDLGHDARKQGPIAEVEAESHDHEIELFDERQILCSPNHEFEIREPDSPRFYGSSGRIDTNKSTGRSETRNRRQPSTIRATDLQHRRGRQNQGCNQPIASVGSNLIDRVPFKPPVSLSAEEHITLMALLWWDQLAPSRRTW